MESWNFLWNSGAFFEILEFLRNVCYSQILFTHAYTTLLTSPVLNSKLHYLGLTFSNAMSILSFHDVSDTFTDNG